MALVCRSVLDVRPMNKIILLSTFFSALLLSSFAAANEPEAKRMRALESAFHAAHPTARLDRAPGPAPLALASRLKTYVAGDTPLERAQNFLDQWREVFGLEQLQLVHAKNVVMKDRVTVRFDLAYEGLPVVGRQVVATFDQDGALLRVMSDALPVTPLRKRLLTAPAAVERAEQATGLTSRDASLVREAVQLDGRGASRVWLVELPGQTAVVDGRTGALRAVRKGVHQ